MSETHKRGYEGQMRPLSSATTRSMADNRFVVFPCDHKSWSKVRAILTAGKASRSTDSWIATFQRAHDVLHTDPGEAMAGTGAKSKTRNVFSGLHVFLDSKTTLEESYRYINHVFPQIVDLALEIETLRPENGLEVLRQRREEVRVVSKRLAASIVSCAFLCLFPGRCPSQVTGLQQSPRLSVFSFDDFFLHLESDFQCEKLRCILHYFSTLSELHSRPLGNLAFSRKVLRRDDVPKPEDWLNSAQPLCPIVVHTSGHAWSDTSAETVQVMLGSKHLGGSVLGSGQTQEDLWFCEKTELMSGMLFVECLADFEAFYVSGVYLTDGSLVDSKLGLSHGSDVASVPDSVAVHASSDESVQFTSECRMSVCLIDSSMGEKCRPYRQHTIIDFLSRMLTGLRSESTGLTRLVDNPALASGISDDILGGTESSSALEEDVAEETSETDLPLSSESLGSFSDPQQLCSRPSPSFPHEIGSRPQLHRARPARNASSWRSNSSTDSSTSFPDSLSRAMSLEVDTCLTPDDVPSVATLARRRSGQSSRRGSAIQGQSSFASESGDAPNMFSGYGRRRSSGMSDMSRRSSSSSGSSAGKRSSADYSSEMEEYCENFQRSIIKTSVIEEESGAMSLTEEDVIGAAAAAGSFGAMASELANANNTQSRMPQKFSIDRPKDVAKPKPIKGVTGTALSSGAGAVSTPVSVNLMSVPCNPTALDHFVDNLINEVAQDSKLEIEEIVREQRMNQILGNARNAKEGSSSSSSSAGDLPQAPALFGRFQKFGDKTAERERKKSSANTVELEDTKLKRKQTSGFSGNVMSLPHCRSCERVKEELDEFVTDFLNDIFREAVDVYCRHFGSRDGSRRKSHVEEIWIAPDASHRHSVPSLDDRKPFQNTHPPWMAGRTQRPLEQFSSQSFDEDIHRLHPPSTSVCASSLCPQVGDKTFLGTAKSNDHSQPSLGQGSRSVCCSWNVSSSRMYLLGLFSTSAGLHPVKPPTSMEWYVLDLLVDAFDDALGELFGATSLQNSLQAMQPTLRGPQPGKTTTAEPSLGLLRFADDMARKIVTVGRHEAARHVAVAGSASCRSSAQAGAHSGTCFSRRPQMSDWKTLLGLEEIASEFANQLIDEAVHIVAGSGPLQKAKRSVVAEHCPDGVFGQEPQLLALLQWLSASASSVSELRYNIAGSTQISQMDVICQIVLSHELTVGSLLSEILVWCRQKREQPNDIESLFDFLLIRLT